MDIQTNLIQKTLFKGYLVFSIAIIFLNKKLGCISFNSSHLPLKIMSKSNPNTGVVILPSNLGKFLVIRKAKLCMLYLIYFDLAVKRVYDLHLPTFVLLALTQLV